MPKTIIHAEDLVDRDYGALVDGRCSKCGAPVTTGEFPFCPHGRLSGAIISDEIPGGVTVENYGPHPITFYSHSERRAYMRQHGLAERETFAPLPGTDRDPQGIPNPNGYRDLSAAAILIRNGRRTTDEEKERLGGGSPLDSADKYDIPNDPALGRATPGRFEDVERMTPRRVKEWMQQ